jgi:hypothetical protein
MLLVFGGHDAYQTASIPTDMTRIDATNTASLAQESFYENRNSGAVTKTISWSGGDDGLTAFAVVLEAT